MNKHLVSIIIPVYNTNPKFLNICFESIFKQTFDNFEILIIDSSTSEVTKNYLKGKLLDNRIKYFESEKGVSKQRNIGLIKSKGDLICFIDSDDYIDKNYLETLVADIDKGFDISSPSIVKETFSGDKIISKKILYPKNEGFFLTKDNYFSSVLDYSLVHPVKIYKKDIIEKNFDEKISYGEDMLFNYELAKRRVHISFTDKTFYHYTCELKDNAIGKRLNRSSILILKKLIHIYKYDNLALEEKQCLLERFDFIFLNAHFYFISKFKLFRLVGLYRYRLFYLKKHMTLKNFLYMLFPIFYFLIGKIKSKI